MLKLKPLQLKHFPLFSSLFSSSASNYLNCHLNSFLSNRSPATLLSLLQSHALILTTGNSSNIFLAAKLISLYASLGKPDLSTEVFDSLCSPKDIFLWNSIIKSHFSNGNYPESFSYYVDMRLSEVLPSDFTIPMVVGGCAELCWLDCGRYVHGLVSKCGFFNENSAVGSSFVYMYAKCGSMENACLVFDEIIVRDVVSWTALVIGYVQNGDSERGLECLREMIRVGGDDERPNFRTLEGGFHACGKLGLLAEGRCLHGLVVKSGLDCYVVVQSSVLLLYSKWGNIGEAYASFCEVVDKDIISWTSIIGVYARFGLMKESTDLFWKMQDDGICPDGVVISCMFLGFGNFMSACEGKAFHGLIVRRHYMLDQTVQNALLSMYCKFGLLSVADQLFGFMPEHNTESWNTMVSGYSKMGNEAQSIRLFREMQHLGIETDSNSLVSVIVSCSQLGAICIGLSVHGYIIKNHMGDNISIANSLIDMYGKSGKQTFARRIFQRTPRDVITWNSMISSYTHCGNFAEAVALFEEMVLGSLKPNLATFITVLSACSHLASSEKGETIHNYIKEEGYELSQSLATSLVDMYAKCGRLEKSRELFDSMKERDAVSWNVMISGYGMHGDAELAFQVFQQMETSNVKPNALTFLALLSSCTHSGLVEEGKYLFDRMHHYSLKPNLKHYACMVDLLGRSGNLQEAEALVMSMPMTPDGGVWGALLSSCIIHDEIEMGIRIAKRAIESDPDNDGYYITISNMYSSTGRWKEAERAREVLKERGMAKKAAWSAL
ncbi:hypothetical protein SLEP1_g7657 [Rubroshorea leprosula]|uniref:Pentatricopeptide repeat-containing protein n=1 Tax=Rubroshorea leprosula TaxID=152421 RepID=A0AAV5I768_9ROSI|nr:hypothetical protein SLEP1_g7657 [Rubroshorea leprosula]